jgi:hypothetical protein
MSQGNMYTASKTQVGFWRVLHALNAPTHCCRDDDDAALLTGNGMNTYIPKHGYE